MKKKIVFVLLILLLTTGCSADYTIKIYDGKIEEDLYVYENDLFKANVVDDMEMSFKDYALEYSQKDKIYTSHYNMYSDNREDCIVTWDNDCSFYNSSYVETSDEVGFSLYNDFSLDKYSDATIPNDFIPGFVANYDGKTLNISGGSDWKFLNSYTNLDRINIKVQTNYKVISTNAKHDGNGEYSWEIDKNNNNKMEEIYMILDTSSTKKFVNSKLILLIVFSVVSIGLIIGFIVLNNKRKDNNRV